MKRLRLLYVWALERLYLRAIQTRYVEGTDPDDGGHGELKWGWNDPDGTNRPLIMVQLKHTKTGQCMRMLMSPAQVLLQNLYTQEALQDQARKFGYDPLEPPEYDTRYIRVPDKW